MIGILKSFNLCYLATPYRKYKDGLSDAFVDAARLAGQLTLMGINVYSPIVHGHPLSVYGGVPDSDYDIWMPLNAKMCRYADCLIVGTLEGWDMSKGVQEEINWFKEDDKTIYYVDPRSM